MDIFKKIQEFSILQEELFLAFNGLEVKFFMEHPTTIRNGWTEEQFDLGNAYFDFSFFDGKARVHLNFDDADRVDTFVLEKCMDEVQLARFLGADV